MNRHIRIHIGRLALPALVGALSGPCAPPAVAALTDIFNAPLASSSNQTAKPNLLFILDDSGSMTFDALPDNAETQQGGSERKYWDTSFNCKWRTDTTGFRGNHCDRVDPPFGASDFNGLYYNPLVTYSPALNYDGTGMTNYDNSTTVTGPHGTWSAVPCDGFPSAWKCDDFYKIGTFHDYYQNGSTDVDPSNGNGYLIGPGHGPETWTNANTKQWYWDGVSGSGIGNSTFPVQTRFPEVVYCQLNSMSSCRRNGLSDATDPTQTGNPFRYTSAVGPSLQTPANVTGHNGYPEAPPVSEFWRLSGNSTITVTTPGPHKIAAITPGGSYPSFAAPFKIIPRTNTGTGTTGLDYISAKGTCNTDTTCTITPTTSNQFTYSNAQTGKQLAASSLYSTASPGFGSYDLVVPLQTDSANPTGSGTSTSTTVYVTAPNHGLIANDKINMFLITSNTNILCTNPTQVTVLATPAPTANTFAFTTTGCSTIKKNIAATGYFQRIAGYMYSVPKLQLGTPFYYTLKPVEYCSDEYYRNCVAATTAVSPYVYAATVRFCLTEFDANRLDTPTGMERTGTLFRCQRKYNPTPPAGGTYLGYVYPRYGMFQRGEGPSAPNITPGTAASYGGRLTRKDCAGNLGASPTGKCTGNEEMTNFANWFAYYRTRMPMMKSSAGQAFSPYKSEVRVGFLTINAAIPPGSNDFLGIDFFTPGAGGQKQKWYNILYAQVPSGSTPLPLALSRGGRYFGGKNDGINKGMIPAQANDPVQYSCQQNFALLTTDGYWNQRAGKSLTDTSTSTSSETIGNRDNVFNCVSTDPHTVCSGVWDGYTTANTFTDASGNTLSTSGTLADVAQYYYNTDLRGTGATGALGQDVGTDNVPNSQTDPATWQHMNTFGLGMSEGYMNWRKDYATATSGDYFNVMNGGSGCSWDPSCRWPTPGAGSPAALDDLWHAAVNGRGAFFYAHDTAAVQDGLFTALNNLNQRTASASAAATSSPNITPTDRLLFKSSYTTVQWNGEIQAYQIDPVTGIVQSGVLWSAKAQLQGQVGPSTDTRTIYTFSPTAANKLKDFKYGTANGLSATATVATSPNGGTVTLSPETPWFDNKCVPITNMSQCVLLDPVVQLPASNLGSNMVNFLRGQTQFEGSVYRDRAFSLGDTVNAAPWFVGKPRMNFLDNVPTSAMSYQQWAASQAGRQQALYVGANDGMLHAFNANSGVELWAYAPRMVLPNMWQLADSQYAAKHAYFVDGTPTSMDIFDGANWRTILVGGLNSGGRGYYALDITNPLLPQGLWEFCNDSTMCVSSDPQVGLSYGNPIITKNAIGQWVVLLTSGYNNVNTPNQMGDGGGYLYVLDVLSGKILQKVATGAGSATSPSGLAKINVWVDTFVTDDTASAVYGGDLQGNLWEFDMTSWPISAPKKIGQTLDATGRPQPITTKPSLGLIDDTYSVLFVGTGRYLGTTDLTDPATQTPSRTDAWQQSLYAIKISPHNSSDTIYGNLRSGANGLVKQTITVLSSQTRGTSTNNVSWATGNGWYVDFNPSGDSPGELVNVDPQLVLGDLIVATNVPGGGACSVGGDSFFYQFDYKTGEYTNTSPGGVVGMKIQGAETVGISIYQTTSRGLGIAVVDSSSGLRQPPAHPPSPANTAKRSGWREVTPH